MPHHFRTGLLLVATIVWGSSGLAEPTKTTGVAIGDGAQMLTASTGLGSCALVEADGHAVSGNILQDDRNGYAILRVEDREGSAALRFARAPAAASERVLLAGFPEAGGDLGGTLATVSEPSKPGDLTRFQIDLRRRFEVAAAIVVDDQGHLAGLVALDEARRATTRDVIHAGVLRAVAEANGFSARVGRRDDPRMDANAAFAAVRDAVVEITCYSEDDLRPTAPSAQDIAEITDLMIFRLEEWSSPNSIAFEAIGGDYARRVDYYGSNFTQSEVIADKRRFAERWPLRLYTLRENSLNISCEGTDCRVTGLLDFAAVQGPGGRKSIGVSDFVYGIDLNAGLIVSENGTVVSRGSMDHAGATELWAARIRDCRRNAARCAVLEYTETVMAEIGLCPEGVRTSRRLAHCPAQ